MRRIAIKQNYIVNSVLFVSFLCVLSLGLIGGCSDDNNNINATALTENDFAEDSSLKADLDEGVIVTFLESPMSEEAEKDTGDLGKDDIPVRYDETTEQTFCWEDEDEEAMHFMELRDLEGNLILTVEVNGDCVTQVIEAGDYVISIFHDETAGDPRPIFLIPDSEELEEPEQAVKTDGYIDRISMAAVKLLGTIEKSVTKDARAQSVEQNRQTLLNTNRCPGCNLAGANLRGRNLVRAELSGADLSRADLTNANMVTVRLFDANLTSANFTNANLRSGQMDGANLRSAHFPGARMAFAFLPRTDATNANFRNADLSEVFFNNADLTGATLTGANLSNARLGNSTCLNTNMSGANLSSASLVRTDLTRANLSGANLRNASMDSAICFSTNLSGTDLTDVVLTDAILTNVNMNDSTLRGARLNRTSMIGARLNRADLINANLSGVASGAAVFNDANLTGANFTGADSSGAFMRRANLTNANLTNANFSFVNFTGANLTGAVLSNTDFSFAVWCPGTCSCTEASIDICEGCTPLGLSSLDFCTGP